MLMKITKEQLKQLIKEELAQLNEGNFDSKTGLPKTADGFKMCANDPACIDRALKALTTSSEPTAEPTKQTTAEPTRQTAKTAALKGPIATLQQLLKNPNLPASRRAKIQDKLKKLQNKRGARQ